MAKSIYASAVDEIQGALRTGLKARGFKSRGRTFNRVTGDGLTQVVSIQMGASDPPGTAYIPGLRENLHGLFTVRGFRSTTAACGADSPKRAGRIETSGGMPGSMTPY